MLTLTVQSSEQWNTETNEFVYIPGLELQFEHSLVTLSKWEEKWNKPFLGQEPKTTEETLDYVRIMCQTDNVPPEVFQKLSNANIEQINEYINAKMSATWFGEKPGQTKGPNREIITAEVLYYWMFSAQVPLECEHWHLNRLFTLLKVFGEKNAPAKKMNRHDAAARQRALNEQRKAKMGTSG